MCPPGAKTPGGHACFAGISCWYGGTFYAWLVALAGEPVSDLVAAGHGDAVLQTELQEGLWPFDISVVRQVAVLLGGVPAASVIRDREPGVPHDGEKAQVALLCRRTRTGRRAGQFGRPRPRGPPTPASPGWNGCPADLLSKEGFSTVPEIQDRTTRSADYMVTHCTSTGVAGHGTPQ